MRNNYDLDDNDDDYRRWPLLEELLTAFEQSIKPVYERADAKALVQQRWHGRLVWWAAIGGTLAVLCAIVELASAIPSIRLWIGGLEVVAAAIAIVVVGLGMWSAFHPYWLQHRFVAEQCRFIKFHLLLNPSVWYGKKPVELKKIIDHYVHAIKSPDKQLIHKWVTWRRTVCDRFQNLPVGLGEDLQKQIVEYVIEKRLDYQRGYFHKQAEKRHRWEKRTRNVSPVCFFLSIVFAFAHFVFEWLAGEDHHGLLHTLGSVSVVLAAALPTLAAGVRTIRSAYEFGRNQLRFEAMSHFLGVIDGEVKRQTAPATAIEMLREAEQALESEHRAWLRLMIEAEWFG
ncbi:MAG: hypothetical protein U0930_24085 [Pirellulales bacterium]